MQRFASIVLLLCSILSGCSAQRNVAPTPRKADPVASAVNYLVAQQKEDGAWRSQTIRPFEDGPSLTPVVLKSLVFLPKKFQTDRDRRAVERGAAYLAGLKGSDLEGLPFPAYSIALTVIVLSRTPGHEEAKDRYVDRLLSHQMVEDGGYGPEDPEYGGWGETIDPPKRPPEGTQGDAASSPNISVTLFAIGALRIAGHGIDSPPVEKALRFVESCQNFPEDGGFFYSPIDTPANKAGKKGDRLLSYGSPTADGLRALQMCGGSDERVKLARDWLVDRFSVESVPGLEPTAGQPIYFYYCWSVSHALSRSPVSRELWAPSMEAAILSKQRADGSWSNSAKDMMEDDPLVATPLALAALILASQEPGTQKP